MEKYWRRRALFVVALLFVSPNLILAQEHMYYLKKCKDLSETDSDSTTYYCDLAETRAIALGQDSLLGWVQMYRGILLSVQGDYPSSTTLFFDGLREAEKYNDLALKSELNNNLGINYFYQEDYQKALKAYEIAKDIGARIGNKQAEALGFMNIGMCYGYLGDQQKELDHYETAETIFEGIRDSAGLADVILNIGTVHIERGEYAEGLRKFEKANKIYLNQKNYVAQSQNYQNLAETYREIGNYDKAVSYALKSLELTRIHGFKQDELHTLGILHKLYSDKNSYKKAYDYLKEYHNLENEIFNIEKTSEILKLETAYNTEKNEASIKLLSAENNLKTARLRTYQLMTAGALCLALLIAGMFYLYRRKQSLESSLMKANLENLRTEITNLLGQGKAWTQDSLAAINEHLETTLSDRELEILEKVLEGKTNDEVAEEIHLSVNTIKYHLKSIYSKLGVANRKEAKRFVKQAILDTKSSSNS